MLENSRITQTDQEIAGSARFFRSLLEGQGAPQNSFVSILLVDSIPTAPPYLHLEPAAQLMMIPNCSG